MKLYMLWGIFLLSGGLLGILLMRNRFAFQWLGKLCLHLALACMMLYIVNLFSSYTRLELPLNAVTVGTISILGIPGLVVLAALKLWVL